MGRPPARRTAHLRALGSGLSRLGALVGVLVGALVGALAVLELLECSRDPGEDPLRRPQLGALGLGVVGHEQLDEPCEGVSLRLNARCAHLGQGLLESLRAAELVDDRVVDLGPEGPELAPHDLALDVPDVCLELRELLTVTLDVLHHSRLDRVIETLDLVGLREASEVRGLARDLLGEQALGRREALGFPGLAVLVRHLGVRCLGGGDGRSGCSSERKSDSERARHRSAGHSVHQWPPRHLKDPALPGGGVLVSTSRSMSVFGRLGWKSAESTRSDSRRLGAMETKAIVVVGAGPGVGASVARRFGREGYDVGLVARSADTLERLESDLRAARVSATSAPVDITDQAGLTGAVEV